MTERDKRLLHNFDEECNKLTAEEFKAKFGIYRRITDIPNYLVTGAKPEDVLLNILSEEELLMVLRQEENIDEEFPEMDEEDPDYEAFHLFN